MRRNSIGVPSRSFVTQFATEKIDTPRSASPFQFCHSTLSPSSANSEKSNDLNFLDLKLRRTTTTTYSTLTPFPPITTSSLSGQHDMLGGVRSDLTSLRQSNLLLRKSDSQFHERSGDPRSFWFSARPKLSATKSQLHFSREPSITSLKTLFSKSSMSSTSSKKDYLTRSPSTTRHDREQRSLKGVAHHRSSHQSSNNNNMIPSLSKASTFLAPTFSSTSPSLGGHDRSTLNGRVSSDLKLTKPMELRPHGSMTLPSAPKKNPPPPAAPVRRTSRNIRSNSGDEMNYANNESKEKPHGSGNRRNNSPSTLRMSPFQKRQHSSHVSTRSYTPESRMVRQTSFDRHKLSDTNRTTPSTACTKGDYLSPTSRRTRASSQSRTNESLHQRRQQNFVKQSTLDDTQIMQSGDGSLDLDNAVMRRNTILSAFNFDSSRSLVSNKSQSFQSDSKTNPSTYVQKSSCKGDHQPISRSTSGQRRDGMEKVLLASLNERFDLMMSNLKEVVSEKVERIENKLHSLLVAIQTNEFSHNKTAQQQQQLESKNCKSTSTQTDNNDDALQKQQQIVVVDRENNSCGCRMGETCSTKLQLEAFNEKIDDLIEAFRSACEQNSEQLIGGSQQPFDCHVLKQSVGGKTPPRNTRFFPGAQALRFNTTKLFNHRSDKSGGGRPSRRSPFPYTGDTPCSLALSESIILGESRIDLELSTISAFGPTAGGESFFEKIGNKTKSKRIESGQQQQFTKLLSPQDTLVDKGSAAKGLFDQQRFKTLLADERPSSKEVVNATRQKTILNGLTNNDSQELTLSLSSDQKSIIGAVNYTPRTFVENNVEEAQRSQSAPTRHNANIWSSGYYGETEWYENAAAAVLGNDDCKSLEGGRYNNYCSRKNKKKGFDKLIPITAAAAAADYDNNGRPQSRKKIEECIEKDSSRSNISELDLTELRTIPEVDSSQGSELSAQPPPWKQ